MAMKFFKEAKVATGEYEKNGETKKSYTKIGALFQDPDTGNMALKLDVIPMPKMGNDGQLGCWISFFDPYEKQQAQQGGQPQGQPQQQGFQQAPPQQQGFQQPPNNYQPPQQGQPQQAFQGANDGIPY